MVRTLAGRAGRDEGLAAGNLNHKLNNHGILNEVQTLVQTGASKPLDKARSVFRADEGRCRLDGGP